MENKYDLLRELNEEGESAGSDYHYGLDGWFGWRVAIEDGEWVLKVSFSSVPEPGDTESLPVHAAGSWRLVEK